MSALIPCAMNMEQVRRAYRMYVEGMDISEEYDTWEKFMACPEHATRFILGYLPAPFYTSDVPYTAGYLKALANRGVADNGDYWLLFVCKTMNFSDLFGVYDIVIRKILYRKFPCEDGVVQCLQYLTNLDLSHQDTVNAVHQFMRLMPVKEEDQALFSDSHYFLPSSEVILRGDADYGDGDSGSSDSD